jgi:hypothetical protein
MQIFSGPWLFFAIQVASTAAPRAPQVDAVPGRALMTGSDSTACVAPSPSCPPGFLSLAVAPDMSLRAGAENVLLLHHAVTRTEDRLLGTRWFPESSIPGKLGGVLGRFGKYALLDLPVDYFTVVYAHEYFGHGGRYREFGIGNIDYGYDPPPPYGPGGGQASTSLANGVVSDHEHLAIWAGGIEAHPMLQRNIALRWMANGSVHYRDASLYWWTWQIMFSYIQSSGTDLTTGAHDNDPQAYVRILNRHAGYANLDSLAMDVADLKRHNLVNLANPFVYISLVAQVRALWDGRVSTGPTGIRIGAWRYLPSLRMDLTPFGPEYHWDSYLQARDRVALLDIRVGDQTFHRGWGGAGLLLQNVYGRGRFSLDLDVNAWKQPRIEVGGSPGVFKGGALGAAAALRSHYQVAESESAVWAFLEVGYKTAGFVDGYALDASPLLMAGLGWRR